MNLAPKSFSRFRSPLKSPKLVSFSRLALATTATVAFYLSGMGPGARAELKDSPKAVLDEAWQIVNRDYVDPTFNKNNWQTIRQELLSKNYTSRDEAYQALRGALEKLEDPYTRFMNPKQYEALTSQTSGEMSGVGMRLEEDKETKVVQVVEPVEDSPAMKAGIKPGDRILQVDGKSTKGMTVADVAQMIRGAVGTPVTLRLGRNKQPDFDVTLTRTKIQLQAVRYNLKEDGGKRVGYIHLQEFSSHSGEQMQKAIGKLLEQNAQAFVLDLRGNPGGLLRVSIDIARMWMDEGAIVSTVDRDGKSQEVKASHRALTDLPLVVLVDDNSASASEILSGALKDNKRAVIMGTQTFGKALVQSVHSLSDGSGLAVTIAHYYTPNGTDISHKGITPDVKVELTEADKSLLSNDPKLIATMKDPVYARAIGLLTANKLTPPLAVNEKVPVKVKSQNQ